MDGHYAWEKMYLAVRALATDTGSLRARLEDACIPSLISLRLEHHFPWPDLREDFENLMHDMAPEGHFKAALALWPEEDLKRIAGDIVDIYNRITRRLGE